MEKEQLNEKDSLAIIEGMIAMAQGNVQSNQFYFIMWGWAVALINLFVYVSQVYYNFEYAHLAWSVCMPLGIFTGIHAGVKAKKRQVKTHLDDMFGYIWMAYFVTIMIIIGAAPKLQFQVNPLIVLITGFPTFVTGLAIKFRPLIFGGAAFWIFAVIGFMIPIEYQNLIGALAVMVGYLIPGYLLKRKVRNESI